MAGEPSDLVSEGPLFDWLSRSVDSTLVAVEVLDRVWF